MKTYTRRAFFYFCLIILFFALTYVPVRSPVISEIVKTLPLYLLFSAVALIVQSPSFRRMAYRESMLGMKNSFVMKCFVATGVLLFFMGYFLLRYELYGWGTFLLLMSVELKLGDREWYVISKINNNFIQPES